METKLLMVRCSCYVRDTSQGHKHGKGGRGGGGGGGALLKGVGRGTFERGGTF